MVDPIAALSKQIERKKSEIAALEQTLMQERAFLQGLEGALKTISRNAPVNESTAPVQKKPRPGTDVARSMEQLQLHGKPMHIDELLSALGKEITKANRLSLAGSLAGYVRGSKWFTRPLPNTFGLVGMEFDSTEQDGSTDGPVM